MSDPHQSEGAAQEDGEGRSAVRLEDAPTTSGTDHEHGDDDEAVSSTETDGDAEAAADDDTAVDDDTVVDEDDDAADEHEAGTDDVDATDDDDLDEDEDDESGGSRVALFSAIGVAAVAVIGVLVLLAAFVWPDFTGPGKPDATAAQAISALASKDPGKINEVSCKRLDGKPSAAQLPAEALQLIQSATPAGGVTRSLDTEARQPVSLTLAAGGQSQTVPAEVVLAVTGGHWCMNSIGEGQ